MFVQFYDATMTLLDEVELGDNISYDKNCINHAEGRLNNVSSLFIICADEERGDVTQETLSSFYKPLVIRKLADQNEKIIKEGFYSQSFDALFSFDSKDQDNISQELTLMTAGLTSGTHEWKTKDKGNVIMTDEQFKTFCVEAGTHKRFHMSRYWNIEEKVNACTSLEALQQIDDIETAEDILDFYNGGE